jgi:pyruvate carboxylase
MSGTTSQPSLSALVAALAHTERDTGLDLQASATSSRTGRRAPALPPVRVGLPAPTGRVYHHEIPGGQLSNLRQQAIALGLADDFERIEDMYAAADRILGRIPKVTPSSKVVGDLALALVAAGADPADFEQNPQNYDIPDSVIGFMAGELGDLPGGWPEPFRTKVLAGGGVDRRRPDPPTSSALDGEPRAAALNRLLFPGPTRSSSAAASLRRPVRPRHADYLYGLAPGEEHVVEIEPGCSSTWVSRRSAKPTTRACAPS